MATSDLNALQLSLIFHNNFGQPPEDCGFTVEDHEGQEPVLVAGSHTLRLLVAGGRAHGWALDGAQLLNFTLYARNDPRAEDNRAQLLARL